MTILLDLLLPYSGVIQSGPLHGMTSWTSLLSEKVGRSCKSICIFSTTLRCHLNGNCYARKINDQAQNLPGSGSQPAWQPSGFPQNPFCKPYCRGVSPIAGP